MLYRVFYVVWLWTQARVPGPNRMSICSLRLDQVVSPHKLPTATKHYANLALPLLCSSCITVNTCAASGAWVRRLSA